MYKGSWLTRSLWSDDGHIWVWIAVSLSLWVLYGVVHLWVEVPFLKKHGSDRVPLYDVGHIDLPENTQKTLATVNDRVVLGIIGVSVVTIAVMAYPRRLRALTYLLFFTGLLYVLKTITSIVTVLPDSSGRCRYGRLLGSCNELYFSGHVAVVLTMFVILLRVFPSSYDRHIRITGVMATTLVSILAVLSRNHYTIDVLGAVVMILFLKEHV